MMELRRIGIDAEADQPKDLVSLTVGVARVLDAGAPFDAWCLDHALALVVVAWGGI